MKSRRHHNNKGLRQIKNGKTRELARVLRDRVLGGKPAGILERESVQNDSSCDAEKMSHLNK